MESAAVAQAWGAIDLAIVGVMADGGLRRSEAAALTLPAADFRRLERGIESVSAVVLRFVDLIVGR